MIACCCIPQTVDDKPLRKNMARRIRSWWRLITGVSTFLSLVILKRFICIPHFLMHGIISCFTGLHTRKSVYHPPFHWIGSSSGFQFLNWNSFFWLSRNSISLRLANFLTLPSNLRQTDRMECNYCILHLTIGLFPCSGVTHSITTI